MIFIAIHSAYPLGFAPRAGAFSIDNAPRGATRKVMKMINLSSGELLGGVTEKTIQKRLAKKFPKSVVNGVGINVEFKYDPHSVFRDIHVTFPK